MSQFLFNAAIQWPLKSINGSLHAKKSFGKQNSISNVETSSLSMRGLLPPAPVGWEKLIVSLCLFVHRGRGYPHPWMGEVPPPGQVEYLIPGRRGIPPVQPWMGEYPHPDRGVPPSSDGVLHLSRWGYLPRPGMGLPPRQGLSTRRAVCLLRSCRRTFLLTKGSFYLQYSVQTSH